MTHHNILIVEDNPGDVELIIEMLDELPSMDLDIERVSRLSEALETMSKQHFDIVLMDLGLPDSSGLDTLRKLLRRRPNAAVVVITGLADNETGLESLKSGAQDYLVKGSIDSDLLNRTISHAIERKQAEISVKK
ncbi:MAG: response regulator [candidate division KSB1 bacterium]|nr:response regulator [candidate division KSB1 bacterium]